MIKYKFYKPGTLIRAIISTDNNQEIKSIVFYLEQSKDSSEKILKHKSFSGDTEQDVLKKISNYLNNIFGNLKLKEDNDDEINQVILKQYYEVISSKESV